MRGPAELLFLAVLLAGDFRGRGDSGLPSEVVHRRQRRGSGSGGGSSGNLTLRVGAIFTKEDIESGANIVSEVNK